MRSWRRLFSSLSFGTLLFVAVGCGQAAAAGHPEAGSGVRCADRVAHALSHADSTPGAWDCLDRDLQNRMHAFAVDGDSGLAAIAFRERRASSAFIGRVPDGGYIYWFRGDQRDGVLLIWLDPDGHVRAFNSTEHPDVAEQGPVQSQPLGR